jgi:hypothetical protein
LNHLFHKGLIKESAAKMSRVNTSCRLHGTATGWAAPNWLIAKVAESALSIVLIVVACCAAWVALDVGIRRATAADSSVAAKAPVPSLRIIHELQTPGEIVAVTWSSDGSKLAASSIGQSATIPLLPLIHVPNPSGSLITIWDSDGHLYRQIKRPEPFFLFNDTFAFVAGNKQIATPPVSGGASAFSLFDIDTGEVVREIPGLHPDKPRNVNGAKTLIASPDQSVLAVIFGRAVPQQVALFSTRDWSLLPELPERPRNATEEPHAVAFSGDGKLIAVARLAQYVQIYDLPSRRMIQQLDAFPDRLLGASAIAFSPDGSMIAVGSHSARGARRRAGARIELFPATGPPVRIFQVSGGVVVATYDDPPAISSGLAWSPDASILAFITQSQILHIWSPFQPESGGQTITLSAKPNFLLAEAITH